MDTGRRPRLLPALVGGTLLLYAVLVVFAGPSSDNGAPTTSPIVPTTALRQEPSGTTSTTPAPTATYEVQPAAGQEIAGWTGLDGGPLRPDTGAVAVWTGREIVLVVADGAAAAAAYDVGSRRWRGVADPPITDTSSAVAVWTGEEMVVLTTTMSVAYDPGADAWRTLPARPEQARHPVGAAWTGNEVVFIAHIKTAARLADELVATAYQPATDSWRRLADPPAEMSYASVIPHEGRVVLVGGLLDQDNRARSPDELATAQEYDLASDSWTILAGLDVPPNAVVAAPTPGGILAWEYGLETRLLGDDGAWRPANPMPLDFSECYPDTASVGDWVFAWYCGQAALRVAAADAWLEVTTAPDLARLAPRTLVAAGDEAFLWGADLAAAGAPVLWRFAPDRAEAARITASAVGGGWRFAPVPELRWRLEPSLVWTGEQLVAWGGHGLREEIFDGFAFSPATGASRRVPPAPWPGRHGQTAVWTGEEMVVWPSFAALNPRSDEWRALPPPPRGSPAGPTAVWTGREALLLGSFEDADASGIAYDPVTDSWRTIGGSPLQGGSDPAHAWSGRELLLWGPGVPDREFWYQEGAAYNPFADEWRPLPPLPDGMRLSGPVGAWTGGEFVVLGVSAPGQTNGMPHVGGAAYDPAADRWRLTAPLPLSIHDSEGLAGKLLAVRTGDGVAVWLPAPYFGETPQLGFYDPAADRWDVSPHLPVDTQAADMTFTGSDVAILTVDGLLLYQTG